MTAPAGYISSTGGANSSSTPSCSSNSWSRSKGRGYLARSSFGPNWDVPPPPPKVTVAQPVKGSVTLYLQATGNAAAVNTGNLVARVPGFVEKINYKDGDL